MQLTTLGEHLKYAEQAFKKSKLFFGHGTNNAWDEAVAIALHVLQLDPNVDKSIINKALTTNQSQSFIDLVNRRVTEKKPVPYLTHEAWFAHQKYYVDERVIIPRSPFAELIENRFEPWWSASVQPKTILDLCTGSGCMAIACAHVFKKTKVYGIEISEAALEVAKINVANHSVGDRVVLIHSDLFQYCPELEFDIIISNPPYVDEKDMQELPSEFHFEPKLALEAGKDGLEIVDKILSQASRYLKDKGLLFVEVGNSKKALEKKYPKVSFIWLDFERGGEGVFMLNKEDLKALTDR